MAQSSRTAHSDSQFEPVIDEVLRIQDEVIAGRSTWQEHTGEAQHLVEILQTCQEYDVHITLARQIAALDTLQNIAYHNPDQGAISEVANWCLLQWLRLNNQDSSNTHVLRGLGMAWLWKAQPCLARIHGSDCHDGVASSSPDSNPEPQSAISNRSRSSWRSVHSRARSNDSGVNGVAEAIDETPDCLEARNILRVSIDYFDQAIAHATEQNNLSIDIIAPAAEAYMSLGNISEPGTQESCYRRAINLLRTAVRSGFVLSAPLQEYLRDYGRFVEED